MADFKVIETQEDFDKAIKSRLAQKDRELAEQYKDYLSPEQVQGLKDELKKQLDEANDLVAKAKETLAEKDKAVSDLESRAADAETLASLLKPTNTPPLRTTETGGTTTNTNASLMGLLSSLNEQMNK